MKQITHNINTYINTLIQITLSTRFSDTKRTLIDNLFSNVKVSFNQKYAGIIVDKLSDHPPYFVLFKTKFIKETSPTFIQINTINDNSIPNVIHQLIDAEIYNKLDLSPLADVNLNYEIIQLEINKAIKTHIPNKIVKYDKQKHKKINWITNGVIQSIKYRNKLYITLKMTQYGTQFYTDLKTD